MIDAVKSGYNSVQSASVEKKNVAPVAPVTSVKSVSVDSTVKSEKEKQQKGDLTDDLKRTVKNTIEKCNEDERCRRTGIEFSYHEKSKQISIKLYDKETKEVIKEIPPEKTIEMLEKMWELAGILVDEKM